MLVIRASVPQESSLEGYIEALEKDGELVILDEVRGLSVKCPEEALPAKPLA